MLAFDGPLVGDRLPLLWAERFEFEAVLGAPVVFADRESSAPRWVIRAPAPGQPPLLSWDSATRTLTSYKATTQDFSATLNALHTLAWCESPSVTPAPASTTEEAAQRIRDEIAHTYPSFQLRSFDWKQISDRHIEGVSTAEPRTFGALASAWVAQLGDAHTGVRSTATRFNPPYRGALTSHGVVLHTVPEDSAAALAGVAPGWTVEVENRGEVLATTGAWPQHHRQVAARRALAITGSERVFTARSPSGSNEIRWTESARAATLDSIVRPTRRSDGDLTVVLSGFPGALDLSAAFDDVFVGAAPTDHLTLDLRGNPGGSLVAATALRIGSCAA